METTLLFAFIACVLCAVLGAAVACESRKGLGFLVGFLLGPIGVIVAAVMKPAAAPPVAYSGRTAGPTRSSPFESLPNRVSVSRRGEVIGTYELADFMDKLADGSLLETDYYLKDPQAGTWVPLGGLMRSI